MVIPKLGVGNGHWKKSCEGIGIPEIKIVYWGPNSCRGKTAFTETNVSADTAWKN